MSPISSLPLKNHLRNISKPSPLTGESIFLTLKEIIMMKRTYFTAIALAATLAGGQAFAADTSTGKTRDQVKAELIEAVRTGNIVGNDESGRMLNEINPGQYPAQAVTQGNTRAEVRAELAEAIRTGNMPANDESGRMLNEVNPGQYDHIS